MAAHKKFRRKLFTACDGLCHYCSRKTSLTIDYYDPLRATVDHKFPVSRGGTDELENLVNACSACNNMKGDMIPDEWNQFCSENPEWWESYGKKGFAVGWLRERTLVREIEWPWLRELIRTRVMQTGFVVWGKPDGMRVGNKNGFRA